MRSFLRSIRQFLSELRRRNVYQVAVTYVIVGVFVIEAADLTLTRLGLPPWTVTLVIVLVGLGFPIALVMTWALEMTPEGVRVEEPKGAEETAPAPASSPGDLWVGASVLTVLLVAAWLLFPVFPDGTPKGTTKEPSTETAAPVDTTRGASRDRPFVAVLPLENLSPKKENQFFAEGIHTEIISQLSKVSGLNVFPRKTMDQYVNAEKTMSEIGRELDAQAILEGSVRRAAGRVRINVQLTDPKNRNLFWSDTYERDLDTKPIFDIQAEIAERVASALKTKLTEEERKRIESAPTEDLAAYEAYLKGRNEVSRFYGTLKLTQIDRAAAHFREAVRQDPSFAQAHARLADTYRMRYMWYSSDQRWVDSTEAALEQARATNRKVPQTHWVQGFLYIHQDSLEAAAISFRRALDLQPSNAIACSGLSTVRSLQGKLAASVQWAHRAYRLEPNWTFRHREMGTRLKEIGMVDAATAWFRKAYEIDPENALGAWGLTNLYLSRGNVQRAAEIVESYRSRRPGHPLGIRLAAEVALHRGRPEDVKRLLEKMPKDQQRADAFSIGAERMLLGLARLRSGERGAGQAMLQEAVDSIRVQLDERKRLLGWNHLWLARGLAVLGDKEEALAHRRQAMRQGNIDYHATRTDPFFETLRPDPRFQKILRQMKARQKSLRRKVRAMNIDLYPPGAKPDSTRKRLQTDA